MRIVNNESPNNSFQTCIAPALTDTGAVDSEVSEVLRHHYGEEAKSADTKSPAHSSSTSVLMQDKAGGGETTAIKFKKAQTNPKVR